MINSIAVIDTVIAQHTQNLLKNTPAASPVWKSKNEVLNIAFLAYQLRRSLLIHLSTYCQEFSRQAEAPKKRDSYRLPRLKLRVKLLLRLMHSTMLLLPNIS